MIDKIRSHFYCYISKDCDNGEVLKKDRSFNCHAIYICLTVTAALDFDLGTFPSESHVEKREWSPQYIHWLVTMYGNNTT